MRARMSSIIRRILYATTLAQALNATPAIALDFSRGIIHDYPAEKMLEASGRLPASMLTREDSLTISSFKFTGDTIKVLAVLVDWPDRPHTYSKETFDSMLFSRNVYPGGSMADYFAEVSNGNLEVVGSCYGWHTASSNYLDDAPYPIWSFWDFESVLPIIDPFVDFSQFDGNNDGSVDAVIFVRSGPGQEDTQSQFDIWSIAFGSLPGTGPGPFDGVYVDAWNTSPELFPLRDPIFPSLFSGVDTLNGIRVFCHELAHNLGLPDLYDDDLKLESNTFDNPDINDHPVYDWGVMGYYGYGILSIGGGRNPAHMCGWSKIQLGWTTPIILEGDYTNLMLYDTPAPSWDSSIYMIPIDPAEGEYFLLEYRNPQSTTNQFDKFDSDFSCYGLFPFWLEYGNDPLDRGLMITHVHDSVGSVENNGTPTYATYRVVVEDAGYNPAMPYTSNPGGEVTDSAQWWYPYESKKGALFSHDVAGQESFNATTVPNSNGYGGPSGIEITVTSMSADKITINVTAPPVDPDSDGLVNSKDNCPITANAEQLNWDQDNLGDECDNCVVYINDAQEDIDTDDVGDSCAFTAPSLIGETFISIANKFAVNYFVPLTSSGLTTLRIIKESQSGISLPPNSVVPAILELTTTAGLAGPVTQVGFNYSTMNIPDSIHAFLAVAQYDGTKWVDITGIGLFGISISGWADSSLGYFALTYGAVPDFVAGDADGSGSFNIADVTYGIAHIFSGGPAPTPIEAGDANCSGSFNIADVTYGIARIFSGGPPPGCDP